MKTLKWIYELGIKHERRRVKLLIEKHKLERPNTDDIFQQDLWHNVNATLDNITRPQYQIEERQISPLDED